MGVPGRIGELQPFAELGRGAATIVYKAYQQSLNRVVLLKVLRPTYTHTEEIVHRFEDEARLIAQIQHPNVVTIYNYGRADDRSFFVAEFVEGTDLADLLEDRGALPLELATYIIREVAKGLAAAHRANILHRDIKPRNILVGADGQVKLTDFGMASIIPDEETRGEVRGTPAYMAPEQLSQDTTTSASDLFSLGATFYEMVGGRQAFSGSAISECIDRVLNHDPFPALELIRFVPDELQDILQRLLAKDPSERPDDCQHVIEAVNAFRGTYRLSAEAAELAAYLENPEEYQPETSEQEIREIAQEDLVESETDDEVSSPIAGVLEKAAAGYRLLPGLHRAGLGILVVLLVGAAGYLISGQDDETVRRSDRVGYRTVVLPDSIDAFDPLSGYTTYQLYALPGGATSDSAVAASDDQISRAASPPAPRERTVVDSLGYLTVRSTPPSASVFLNGDSLGRTPLEDSIEVDPGDYGLLVRHPEYPEYRDSVAVEASEETTVDAALESLVGRVDIRVSPWAEVYINGALQDTIPYQGSPFMLPPGRHMVSLQHPELGVRDTTIWVTAGEHHQLEFNLHQSVD